MAGEIYNYDVTANNNNRTPPDGWPENMEYNKVNDTGREMMAVLARFLKASLSGNNLTTGTQPNYLLASGYTLSGYASGQLFAFVAHATSSGLVTLNVNDLGASTVFDSLGNQLSSGDITLNGVYYVVRNTIGFQLIGARSRTPIFAAGDKVLSFNTTAPIGWTIDTSYTDCAIRIGTVGGTTGGTASFTTTFADRTPTGSSASHVLTTAEMPTHAHTGQTGTESVPHSHGFTTCLSKWGGSLSGSGGIWYSTAATYTDPQSAYHTHDITTNSAGSGTGHIHTLTFDAFSMATKYMNGINIVKDA